MTLSQQEVLFRCRCGVTDILKTAGVEIRFRFVFPFSELKKEGKLRNPEEKKNHVLRPLIPGVIKANGKTEIMN